MPSIISAESSLTSTPSRAHTGPHRENGHRDWRKWGVLPGEGLLWGLILALSSPRNTGAHLSPMSPACALYIDLTLFDPESPFCPPWRFGQVLWPVL